MALIEHWQMNETGTVDGDNTVINSVDATNHGDAVISGYTGGLETRGNLGTSYTPRLSLGSAGISTDLQAFNNGSEMTVVWWFKFPSYSTDFVFACDWHTYLASGGNSLTITSPTNVDVVLRDDGTFSITTTEMPTNEWFAFALERDASSNWHIWINGVKQASTTQDTANFSLQYILGCNAYATNPTNYQCESIRVYDSVLTEAEHLEIYREGYPAGSGREVARDSVRDAVRDGVR